MGVNRDFEYKSKKLFSQWNLENNSWTLFENIFEEPEQLSQ